MKQAARSSPRQLALLAILGTAIACTPFLLPWHNAHTLPHWPKMLVAIGSLVIGFAIFLKSISVLKNGVENERWSAEQIERLRRFVESTGYKASILALFAAYVAFMLFSKHLHGVAWVCFLLLQMFSQLAIALRRPRVSVPAVQWNSLAPVRSEHWGER